MTYPRRRLVQLSAGASALAVTAVMAMPAAQASTYAAAAVAPAASVSMDPVSASGATPSGAVTLHGSVNPGPSSDITSVLYVVDVSHSTSRPSGLDCNADGPAVAPAGTVATDDLNADGSVGDTLDCEIAAVRSLNTSLMASANSRIQVGLEVFGASAKVASMSATSDVQFVAPDDSGAVAGSPLLVQAAQSLVRGGIGKFQPATVGETTDFAAATTAALAALANTPAGPKWVMFISDGEAPLPAGVLSSIRASGVHLRTFAVGADSACAAGSSLSRMAGATHENCTSAATATALAGQLTGAQPAGILGVTVSADVAVVKADVDPIGGWSARLTLSPGAYLATVTATLTGGITVSTTRPFLVTAGSATTPGNASPAAPRVTLRLTRPVPTLAPLAARVAGTVRLAGTPASRTSGLTVSLQGRSAKTRAWQPLTHVRVKKGAFTLAWKPRAGFTALRVVLPAQLTLAGVVATVPAPSISSCSLRKRGAATLVRCSTVAKNGTAVQVVRGRKVIAVGRVKAGKITVTVPGAISTAVLRVGAAKAPHPLSLRL